MTEPTPNKNLPKEPSIEQVTSLLLSADEMHQTYAKLAEQGVDTDAEPLVLVKKETDKQLVYLGIHHSDKPDRPDLPHILSAWDRFLEATKGNDRIVLIEGGLRPVEKDQDTALSSWGESGLLAYLASKEGVKLATPEPDRKKEVLVVAQKVGRDEAMYYFFARILRQWQRTNTTQPFEEYIENYLANYQRLFQGEDYDFSFEHMIRLYETKHGKSFEAATAAVREDATPGYGPGATASSEYRNIHMVKEILRLWSEDKSIFIVYGSGHLIVQEEALKELLK